jgi:hypothetical protein
MQGDIRADYDRAAGHGERQTAPEPNASLLTERNSHLPPA